MPRQTNRMRNFLPISQFIQTNHIRVLELFRLKNCTHPSLLLTVTRSMPDLVRRPNQLPCCLRQPLWGACWLALALIVISLPLSA